MVTLAGAATGSSLAPRLARLLMTVVFCGFGAAAITGLAGRSMSAVPGASACRRSRRRQGFTPRRNVREAPFMAEIISFDDLSLSLIHI